MDSPVFLAIIGILWALVIYFMLDQGEDSIQTMLIRVGVSLLLIYGLYISPGLVKLIPGIVLSKQGTLLAFCEGRVGGDLSLIHISEPTRLGMSSYAVFC